jgi:hypothetical protein
MENNPFQGEFAETSFPQVLASILREERSGFLRVRRGPAERSFLFDKGELAVERSAFDEPGFFKSLAALGLVRPGDLARSGAAAAEKGTDPLRALVESGIFTPVRLLKLIEDFSIGEIFPVFDWPDGDYAFEPGQPKPGALLVRDIPLPGLILEGIRRMGNFDLIEAHLPSTGETVQGLSSRANERPELAAPERYLLGAAAAAGSVDELCASSVLGARETKRALFALLTLGVLGTSKAKGKNNKPLPEFSISDLDRLFAAFNDQCSFIYKYISKEIGPVALNVIENSLDEIKGRIDPIFQNCELKPDGRIELRTLLKKNLGVSTDESKRSLLRSFDEVLAAEVLAVKRTLGNSHESALVKGLERIGDLR